MGFFFIFFQQCFFPHIGHLCLSGCDGLSGREEEKEEEEEEGEGKDGR